MMTRISPLLSCDCCTGTPALLMILTFTLLPDCSSFLSIALAVWLGRTRSPFSRFHVPDFGTDIIPSCACPIAGACNPLSVDTMLAPCDIAWAIKGTLAGKPTDIALATDVWIAMIDWAIEKAFCTANIARYAFDCSPNADFVMPAMPLNKPSYCVSIRLLLACV